VNVPLHPKYLWLSSLHLKSPLRQCIAVVVGCLVQPLTPHLPSGMILFTSLRNDLRSSLRFDLTGRREGNFSVGKEGCFRTHLALALFALVISLLRQKLYSLVQFSLEPQWRKFFIFEI